MSGKSLRQALAPLIDAVFPPRCPLCGDMLADHQGLCGACWGGLEFPGEPACPRCSRMVRHGVAETCRTCRADPPRHHGVRAATVYNAASRQLVISFKHGGRMTLAPMLARLMAARLRDVGPGWVIVPVPLHRWRMWGRGFNQSGLLAQELGRLTGAQVAVDALVRHRRTPMLRGLGTAERAAVMKDAIAPHPRRVKAIGDARVLLVDDVLTSGATTNACIDALVQAGAAQVRIACFARVMAEHLPHKVEEAGEDKTKAPET